MSDIDFFTLLKDPQPTLRERLSDIPLWFNWLFHHRRCDYCDGRQSYGDWKNLGSCHACWNEGVERNPPLGMS